MIESMIRSALIGVAALTLAIAAPAHADNPGTYLQLLDTVPVRYHDAQSALTMGNAICKSLEVGSNPTLIEGTLEAAMYNPKEAEGIMQASLRALCPPHDTDIWNSWMATFQEGSPPPPPGVGSSAALPAAASRRSRRNLGKGGSRRLHHLG